MVSFVLVLVEESSVKEKIVLEFDLPEFRREDIDIKIFTDKLEIDAKKKEEHKIDEEGLKSFEKINRTFTYSSSLPKVKADKAEIEFERGHLKITVPRV